MFGFQKKEVFVTMDQEQYFRAVTALREQGIPFKTKLENGASMNVMGRGRTTAWGDTLRRLDTYYIYADKKEADQASYIIRQALQGTKK